MSDKTVTTLDRFFVGKTITLGGERWSICSRHSGGGEPFFLLSLIGNSGIVARWLVKDLEEHLK